MAMALPGRRTVTFGLNSPRREEDWGLLERSGEPWLAQGKNAFLPVREMKLAGLHNAANAMASTMRNAVPPSASVADTTPGGVAARSADASAPGSGAPARARAGVVSARQQDDRKPEQARLPHRFNLLRHAAPSPTAALARQRRPEGKRRFGCSKPRSRGGDDDGCRTGERKEDADR